MQKIKHFLKDSYNISLDSVALISNGVINTNYICFAGDRKYILKLYNFKGIDEIRFEVEVLEFLKHHNFPSPRLLTSKNNELIVIFQNKPSILFDYIEGENIKIITPKLLEQAGTLQAEMHNILKDFAPSVEKSTWDPGELKHLVKEYKNAVIESGFPEGLKFMSFANQELERYDFPQDLPKGVTHQDIKSENIIVEGDKIKGIVDFDNSYVGAFLFDIATTIIWGCFKDELFDKKMFFSFINGYSKKRGLSELENEYLEDSIKFRLVREVFIGPFVTMHLPLISKERADYFIRLYEKFKFN